MKLPRRVPWTSISELDQVCTWIFADDSDITSKTLAVNRLSAWKAVTALPHALESTLALLTVSLQDNSPDLSSSSCLSLRHSYAACIIRLVNGLVDPLQLGAYARSIASIAQQLGLPPWLVELRHAATHEDLPSLELLREAARESMNWLFHNYFLPTLNPSITPRLETTLRPLAPILTRYKKLLKVTTRDASLHAHFGAAINSLLREVERWVAEAKVAANVEGFGWGGGGTMVENGDHDMKEKWALDKLCDALLENGILVPVSKKKRVYPEDSFSPPQFSVLLWSPLLTHIQSHHPDLRSALAHRIVSRLLSDSLPSHDFFADPIPLATENVVLDPSFDTCLSRWAWWIVNAWAVSPPDPDYDLSRDIIATLLTALGPRANSPADSKKKKAARDLLYALCKANPDLEQALTMLLPTTSNSLSSQWTENDLMTMDGRWNTLLPQDVYFMSHEADLPNRPLIPAMSSDLSLPTGWRLLDGSSQWRPCPIGVYVGSETPTGVM